ncbi:glycosyltransferase family 1 protein [Aplosporella prunicola CBS 121167]|uniref:Glycosyltransferase family 1 protein n=1 Tax=Aplosporella prunicola CBS 121167 TaxID=1176127 RepID=A0A6A6B397_9PEZI|nr:glycosyltransferase family 1 protein [Aplosporella prunicola CBS 121167]KAF2138530.1 glycosyltransferase family 1 protein [Aplosporella prunicola CBS 121167]
MSSGSRTKPGHASLSANKRETNDRMYTQTNSNRPHIYDSESTSTSSSSSTVEEVPETNSPFGHRSSRRPRRRRPEHQDQQSSQMDSNHNPYSKFFTENKHFRTKGKVSKRDGRLKISLNEITNHGFLANALGPGIGHNLGGRREVGENDARTNRKEQSKSVKGDQKMDLELFNVDNTQVPRLNIVVMVIGSRGDIQPFIRIGKILQDQHGHRVRIATHPAFKEFVEKDSGLEFFSVGGDPWELMAFVVKNPGLIPSVETIKKGEVGRRRAAMSKMFEGMWRACINATDDERDKENMKMMDDKKYFVADAIIANPPSFAHVHIAERLQIPLHLMFTFPYTPTQHFPHPLANIRRSNVDTNYTNFMSYPLVEMMTWQGLGELVNKFRTQTLGLEPVSTLWAPGQLSRLRVPYTYMWSPSLGPEIDVAGFVFLELASSFNPPESLVNFLDAGPPPIYIGFGSIVVDDPESFTKMVFEAVQMAGVRALVSKGWSGIGGKDDAPESIYLLDNTPHDWLFPRVSAVVHHGGAGTTAIGLKCGKPTMVVPFFGDQPFWGAMVASAKAGAHDCTPYKQLTADQLAEGIRQCLSDEERENAGKIAKSIADEGDGAANAVKSFHRSLPLRGEKSLRCSILEDRVAAWHLKDSSLRLSPRAAEVLVRQHKIKWGNLRLARTYGWNDFEGLGEPITGIGSALSGTIKGAATGIGPVPKNVVKRIKKRENHKRKRVIRMEKSGRERGKADWISGGRNETPDGNDDGHAYDRKERSKSPQRGTETSALSADPLKTVLKEIGRETGQGFAETGASIAKAPMDLALALAQGFHNVPRLYGDESVRRPVRISGFYSGLRASRDEFIFGIYDSWTGLYKQPYHGAKEDGAFGFAKGIGMGVAGFVLKDIAAILGPVGYTAKGIHKELRKKPQPTYAIRKTRITQGRNDFEELGENQDADVLAFERSRTRGLGGSIIRHRGRKKWQEAGATDNVVAAEKALAARKRGEDLDSALQKEREEVELAGEPRAGAMGPKAEDEDQKEELPNGKFMSGPGQERELG